MKKVYLAAPFLLLLFTTHIPTANALTSPAIIGLSNLKSILEDNPHPSNTLRSKDAISLIYCYPTLKKQGALHRGEFEANAIELEFDKHEILSTIKLIRFEPSIKN